MRSFSIESFRRNELVSRFNSLYSSFRTRVIHRPENASAWNEINKQISIGMEKKLGPTASLKDALLRDLAVKISTAQRLATHGFMDSLTLDDIRNQANRLAKIATQVNSSHSPAYEVFQAQEMGLKNTLDHFKYAEH